jgi:hypothetical protein
MLPMSLLLSTDHHDSKQSNYKVVIYRLPWLQTKILQYMYVHMYNVTHEANPTIMSYNDTSAVKIYVTTSRLMCFIKTLHFLLSTYLNLKKYRLLQHQCCSCVHKNSGCNIGSR